MAILSRSKQLKKELSLFSVYTIATGATLSSGFFILPGLAAELAGPAGGAQLPPGGAAAPTGNPQ